MAPRPQRRAGRGFRGDGGLRGRGIDRRRPDGRSDRRRRRGDIMGLDPRLRQEDQDLSGERLQVWLERGSDRVQPVHRADVVLERARRRDVLDADRDDGEALRDRAVDFPLDVGRRVRMRREDEHHHPALVDPVDDRLAVVGPVGDVPRGDPAGDPVSLERGAQRIRRGLVLARVADEDVVGHGEVVEAGPGPLRRGISGGGPGHGFGPTADDATHASRPSASFTLYHLFCSGPASPTTGSWEPRGAVPSTR